MSLTSLELLRIICRLVQKNNCRCLILAFSVLIAALVGGVLCMGKEDTGSPESLVAQARKLQEIWTDGTPPVTMRTEIQVLDAKGSATPGQYVVTWLSSSRWREELQIANFKRIRVHDVKGYWQQSTLGFQPEIIFQLDSMLDFNAAVKVGAKQVLSKVKNRNNDGVRQKCTEVKWPTGTERILCFDETSGNLLTVEFPTGDIPPDISRIEYSAFDKLGDKHVPFEFRAFKDKRVVVTAKILDVTPITEANPALFMTPANSEFWPQCSDMQAPELDNRVQPIYPGTARSNGETGRVVFYAVIEPDGAIAHLTLIRSATPALDSAAAEAVRQWHYKPAACGSTPIRVETSIPVTFWLKR